ncbi:uncharacterized protein EV422DRAFT_251155 [Fimicolochytrium jonesii]|uniref:uncharacterized protein n=1 Tax=Fimicolochytrium jonesii TaxID=1396493 RepID=UPI0022FE8D37|nr:uncharacterized protein EV422DRAFT_251155 [Fimicolochytrium jonesii]KAI8825222.1 hypothetical protein EV422DRAFT_251155 [Fimicolochytrium jonesii]
MPTDQHVCITKSRVLTKELLLSGGVRLCTTGMASPKRKLLSFAPALPPDQAQKKRNYKNVYPPSQPILRDQIRRQRAVRTLSDPRLLILLGVPLGRVVFRVRGEGGVPRGGGCGDGCGVEGDGGWGGGNGWGCEGVGGLLGGGGMGGHFVEMWACEMRGGLFFCAFGWWPFGVRVKS